MKYQYPHIPDAYGDRKLALASIPKITAPPIFSSLTSPTPLPFPSFLALFVPPSLASVCLSFACRKVRNKRVLRESPCVCSFPHLIGNFFPYPSTDLFARYAEFETPRLRFSRHASIFFNQPVPRRTTPFVSFCVDAAINSIASPTSSTLIRCMGRD